MKNSHSASSLPLRLGQLTLFSVGLLLVWDFYPHIFPARAHDILGALPLAFIAITYIVFHLVRRSPARELLKGLLLATAFLLWAGNQLWALSSAAILLNDLAIALFVLDVFLIIAK